MQGDPARRWWWRRRQEAEAAAAAATRARSAWERLREDRRRARRIVIGLADRELRRPVAGLEEVNEPGRCFLGSVLGNPVAGWARGSPREYGPAPPPLNAGGVRGSGRGGGGGGRSGRSGESMPPALRFAQAALAARAPVAQDETRLHAARLGSQSDAVAPAASALAPAGHARPLQVIPRHQLSPPARSRTPTPRRAGLCFPGSPGSDLCDWLLARRLLAKRLLEGGVGFGGLKKDS
ncbi:hypothetical protein ACRRTK_017986 [Alexandromys fortis]